jgi:hypothetical protein
LTVNSEQLIRFLRRRLASGALVLTTLQFALLFAAPVSACCVRAGAASASMAAASDDAPDCCPPGAHPKGECPLHRGAKSGAHGASTPNHCRFTCAHSSGPQFVVGSIGVLPMPSSVVVPVAQSALFTAAPQTVRLRPFVPDSPPPELL